MRNETLTESRSTLLSLSASEAGALRALGQQLASKATWWGAERRAPADDTSERSVISCVETAVGAYTVTVANAVGLIAVGNRLQILVGRRSLRRTSCTSLRRPVLPAPRRRTCTRRGRGALLAPPRSVVRRRGRAAPATGHRPRLRRSRRPVASSYVDGSTPRDRAELLPRSTRCRVRVRGLRTGHAAQSNPASAGEQVVRSALAHELRRRMRAILTRFDDVGPLRHGDRRRDRPAYRPLPRRDSAGRPHSGRRPPRARTR